MLRTIINSVKLTFHLYNIEVDFLLMV
jgi:hypothetical protein